jgi:hypothetical protein
MMPLLSDRQKNSLRRFTKGLIEDRSMTHDLIYARLGTSSYNPGTGINAQTFTYIPVKALRGTLSQEEVAQYSGQVAVGDQFYVFDPEVIVMEPNNDDRIYALISCKGKVKLRSGVAAVVGINTYFQTSDVTPDDVIFSDLVAGRILTVTDESNIVLVSNWAGADEDAFVDYAAYREFKVILWLKDPLNFSLKVVVRKAGG